MTTQQISKHNYGSTKIVNLPHETAVERARKALQDNGWGILSEIDICSIMKNKLGVDFPKFTILGACNPTLGLEALKTESQIGLLMPCNVVIRDAEGKVEVGVASATGITSVCNNGKLEPIVTEADKQLKAVLEAI